MSLTKIFLLSVSLSLCTLVSAADYYVRNGGDDQASGTSDATAWATIEKVNAIFPTLKPGDRILFKRGDIFLGTLRIKASGTSASPIIIGAYGTGNNPVITGFTTITSWNSEGNGIYSATISAEALTNMVLIDGEQYAMGRWPDNGYRIYQTANSNKSITDNELLQSPDWKGAEVVIRKNDWSLDRCIITNHSGGTLSYTSMGTDQDALVQHGYFIQNHLNTLDQFGEWFHDVGQGKIYFYFGSKDPSTLKVEVATLKNLAHNAGKDYITIENLHFRGSSDNLIEFVDPANDFITIRNCQILFAGQDGINLWGNNGYLNKNTISSANQTGIQIIGTKHRILDNVIEKIGLEEGQAFYGNQAIGIIVNNNDCQVKNNIIRYVGYSGIKLSSIATVVTIQNNFLHDILLTLNDGGGIYTAREGISRMIDGNIILRVIGNTAGTPYPGRYIARGIYLDVNSTNAFVTNNTVADCNEAGYMIHRAQKNRIENNTGFNNGYGMYYQNSSGSSIRENRMNGNLFISKGAEQPALKLFSVSDDLILFGTADNNHYARPVADDNTIHTYSPATGNKKRTLADWKSFSGQDKNSKKSAVTVSDTSKIQFHYNATTSGRVIMLSQPMVDVTGKKYTGSLTLQPYTSVVLMPDPNPYTPLSPVFSGATVENSTPTVIAMSYNINMASVIPALSAFTVTVNGTGRAVSSVSVQGNRVLLTLASKVTHGDVIVLSYTKPSSNPLQSAEGVHAASITSHSVKNNCQAPAPDPPTAPDPGPVPDPTPPGVQNKPPVVTIATPAKGNLYTCPATIVVDVTAHDSDGTISSIVLYNGTTVLGESDCSCSFTLKDLSEGVYEIYAIVTDNHNASTKSATLTFQILSPPEMTGEIDIYPNPNDGRFTLNFSNPDEYERYQLSVASQHGMIVFNDELMNDQLTRHYDLSHLKPGIYVVIVSAGRVLATQRFIKK